MPGYRVGKLMAAIEKLIVGARGGRRFKARQLVSVVGQIIAMKLSLGNVVRLRTRYAIRQLTIVGPGQMMCV